MGEVNALNELSHEDFEDLRRDIHAGQVSKRAFAVRPLLAGSKSSHWVTPHGSRAQTPAMSGPNSRSASQRGGKSFTLPGSKSLPSLPELHVPQVGSKTNRFQIPQNVPAPMNSYDYWTAVKFFNLYDVHKTGALDKQLFHKMISCCCVLAGLSRRMTGLMFESIDFTGSGKITQEEFLAWIFGTHSCYTNRVRHSLASLNHYEMVRRHRGLRKAWNGYITKEDLWIVLSELCPGTLPQEECSAFFDLLDVHRHGEIDIEGVFDWLRPTRMRGKNKTDQEDSKTSGFANMVLNPSSTGKSALFESPPGSTLTLEFTTSRDFHRRLLCVETSLRHHFAVSFSYIFNNDTDGCSRLIALVGRGILLWDRMTMQAYMDNPLESETSARRWLRQLLQERMPRSVPSRLVQHHKHFAPPLSQG